MVFVREVLPETNIAPLRLPVVEIPRDDYQAAMEDLRWVDQLLYALLYRVEVSDLTTEARAALRTARILLGAEVPDDLS